MSSRKTYQVEKALGHANVAVTEGYLRSLGLVGGGLTIRQALRAFAVGPPASTFLVG